MATAKAFWVSVESILNWHREVKREVVRAAKRRPPRNQLPEIVSDVARLLKREWPRWGTRRIAGMLGRLGLKASRSSVQAWLRRSPRRPVRWDSVEPVLGRGLPARRPGQMWLLDFTTVGGMLRSVVVGAVIDAFSRRVLALRVAP